MAVKRLMAIWAHPDDESFGPVGTMRLAHDCGWQTALVTATRGEGGVSELAALQPGQTLGDFREGELRCAATVLGVDRLTVWRYPDGRLTDVPQEDLLGLVLDELRAWQPHVVITFGPDGITGHPDHLAIGAATTQAFHRLRGGSSDAPQRLYYVTVRPDRAIEKPMGDAPPPLPPTAIIDVSRYESTKREALACHGSQRGDWERLMDDRDWLTVDRFHRAFPPLTPDEPPESTILHE
jgi:N-acetylglucosamine malate deacetylase 2